jgi:hypothetical protein
VSNESAERLLRRANGRFEPVNRRIGLAISGSDAGGVAGEYEVDSCFAASLFSDSVRRMLFRVGALAALFLSSSAALADECSVPNGASPALAQVDTNLRLRFIHEAMKRDTADATTWRWGWVGGYGAIVVTQAVLIPFMKQPSDRIQRYVGGASTIIAMLPPLFIPLEVTKDGPEVDARLKAVGDSGTPEERCDLLHWSETLAARSAHNEHAQTGWVLHVVNLGYNLIVSAVLGFGFKDWTGAAVAGGAGFVLGETQILSQPTRLHEQWEQYKTGALGGEPTPKLSFAVQPGWIGMNGSF